MEWMMKVLVTVVLSFLLCAAAQAKEAWPQRPITIVVPFMAGGSADLLARIVQQHMQADFGSPVVVENRSGAGKTALRSRA
jgi:tripartite-type tricarboxylate transporter receptor subunit TctC